MVSNLLATLVLIPPLQTAEVGMVAASETNVVGRTFPEGTSAKGTSAGMPTKGEVSEIEGRLEVYWKL